MHNAKKFETYSFGKHWSVIGLVVTILLSYLILEKFLYQLIGTVSPIDSVLSLSFAVKIAFVSIISYVLVAVIMIFLIHIFKPLKKMGERGLVDCLGIGLSATIFLALFLSLFLGFAQGFLHSVAYEVNIVESLSDESGFSLGIYAGLILGFFVPLIFGLRKEFKSS